MFGLSRHRRRFFFLLIAGCLLNSLSALPASTQPEDLKIHESVIAGTWYPADPNILQQQLDGFLAAVPARPDQGRLVALISPHAGYPYSGRIAACAYKLLQGKSYDTVVIIAPSHRARFPGVSVYDPGGYQTPLGVVPIDRALIRQLEASDGNIRYRPEAHAREHALEIQLPFLQRMLGHFKLIPLVMGDQSWSACKRLAATLVQALAGTSVLIIASSDLSHYHSAAEAKVLDDVVMKEILDFSALGLYQGLASGRCEACGGGPIVAALLAAKSLGADRTEILRYGHSGEVTGDTNAVVGYLAAAVWRGADGEQQSAPPARSGNQRLHLSPAQKTLLLTLARNAITAKCRNQPAPPLKPVAPDLTEPRGAFVTLHKNRQLRGCIGNIVGTYPIEATIAKMAVAAAFQDPRFPPVEEHELPNLVIEISVLTPLERVRQIDEIQVGRHGLFIRTGSAAGLLLPQGGIEQDPLAGAGNGNLSIRGGDFQRVPVIGPVPFRNPTAPGKPGRRGPNYASEPDPTSIFESLRPLRPAIDRSHCRPLAASRRTPVGPGIETGLCGTETLPLFQSA